MVFDFVWHADRVCLRFALSYGYQMKRKLIRICIVVIAVVTLCGGELNARGHQHLVQKGDTLWGLSRKYKVPLKSIIQANSIQPTKRLQIGEKL